MTRISLLDGVAQAELVARGEVTADELFDAALARIDAMNPLVHAVVTLDRERRAPRGSGPFAGVPFLIKDLTPYPGLRWSMGSRLSAQNFMAPPVPYTSAIDASGLVTIGKTATSELGLLGSTETLLEGVTHNPWDLSYSAAGSSGGAAAAVASGMVPLAHANDGGGSVRIPASVCGLFGFKPSRGRTVQATPQRNDFSELASDHVISRSVRDSALFLSVTETSEAPVGYVRGPSTRRLRIGSFTRTAIGGEPEAEVLRAFEDAVALCRSLGHEVVPMERPDVGDTTMGEAFFLVAGAAIAGLLEMIPMMRGTKVQRHELEPFTWGVVEAFQRRGPDALPWARTTLQEAARVYLAATAGFDAILTPTLATGPWRIGHLSPILPFDELFARTARSVGYTPIHNIAGCPGMSVPLYWSEAGLPIGSHFAAAPGHDALLLGLAYELEQVRPWRDRWAPWSHARLFES